MKKSYSVNISGIIFQIDEDAYEKLNRYLDRLNLHFANTAGKEEIIADIEQRIAEMLLNKLGDHNRIVTLGHIDEVIRVLGEPADFDDNIKEEPSSSDRRYRKRLYRDPDEKVLGGVAGGIGAYFNTDPLWFRIIFIILTLFGGSGILLYLILWLIVPEARTTAERLEMRGEQINIGTIERTIREEMNDLQDRFGRWKKDGYQKKKDSAGRLIETVVQIFVTLFVLFFKLLAFIIGFAILFTGIALIIAIFIPGITLHGFPVLYDASIHEFLVALTGSTGQAWLILVSILLIILIPLLGIVWGGIRLLWGARLRSRTLGGALTGIWFLSILVCLISGIITVNDFSSKGFETHSSSLSATATDTLSIGLQPGPADPWVDVEGSMKQPKSLMIRQDANSIFITGRPVIEFRQSLNDSLMITITKRARGRNQREARERAGDILIETTTAAGHIWIDRFFTTPPGSVYRKQDVKINIAIPENQVIRLDPSLQQNYRYIRNFDPLWDEQILNKPLRMKNHKLVTAQ